MKVDPYVFRQLRQLAPTIEDVLRSGEVEHAGQAVNLAALANLCAEIFDSYRCVYPDEIGTCAREPGPCAGEAESFQTLGSSPISSASPVA